MNSNILYRIFFVFVFLTGSINADDSSFTNIVKVITESKYEFHNQFGEYLDILQNQTKHPVWRPGQNPKNPEHIKTSRTDPTNPGQNPNKSTYGAP